jgi:hypothetical protein
LEARLDTLQQRLAQLELRPAPSPTAAAPDLTAVETRLDQVTAKVTALQGSDPGVVQSLAGKVQALEQGLAQTEQHEQTAARLARLQAAGVALAAGQALGDIPGAPPALATFATAAPPTEGSLRSSFSAVAAAAEQASVQQGGKVLVGPPASHVLAQARARLDDGDLAGAVGALDQLDPAAAKVLAGWRAQAQSLLDARAALAGMVRS